MLSPQLSQEIIRRVAEMNSQGLNTPTEPPAGLKQTIPPGEAMFRAPQEPSVGASDGATNGLGGVGGALSNILQSRAPTQVVDAKRSALLQQGRDAQTQAAAIAPVKEANTAPNLKQVGVTMLAALVANMLDPTRQAGAQVGQAAFQGIADRRTAAHKDAVAAREQQIQQLLLKSQQATDQVQQMDATRTNAVNEQRYQQNRADMLAQLKEKSLVMPKNVLADYDVASGKISTATAAEKAAAAGRVDNWYIGKGQRPVFGTSDPKNFSDGPSVKRANSAVALDAERLIRMQHVNKVAEKTIDAEIKGIEAQTMAKQYVAKMMEAKFNDYPVEAAADLALTYARTFAAYYSAVVAAQEKSAKGVEAALKAANDERGRAIGIAETQLKVATAELERLLKTDVFGERTGTDEEIAVAKAAVESRKSLLDGLSRPYTAENPPEGFNPFTPVDPTTIPGGGIDKTGGAFALPPPTGKPAAKPPAANPPAKAPPPKSVGDTIDGNTVKVTLKKAKGG